MRAMKSGLSLLVIIMTSGLIMALLFFVAMKIDQLASEKIGVPIIELRA